MAWAFLFYVYSVAQSLHSHLSGSDVKILCNFDSPLIATENDKVVRTHRAMTSE